VSSDRIKAGPQRTGKKPACISVINSVSMTSGD
jgi:hypothetical protein